ncbi:MAG: NTP transferase domain-containing protein [Bacteroidota bacterium]
MKAIILMAGVGSRLGKPLPKCLTEIPGGETILGRQLRLLRPLVDEIVGVVGFKKEVIMELHPEMVYVYNPFFARTNTAKSLLTALQVLPADDDLLWVNGDVVFTEATLERVASTAGNVVGVTFGACGEEEIKFNLDGEGYIREISKQVRQPLGEAIGLNKVSGACAPALRDALARCTDRDYFERALELCNLDGVRFKAVDVGAEPCIEVDFIEDLQRVWTVFRGLDQEGG